VWVCEFEVRLIPAVPLGLSIALIRNGLAARGRGEVGSRAYCSVGVVLATFAVTSVNRRWLDGTVPAPWALATGCGLSTALAAWVRERSEDRSYEHFVFGGLALTVVLLMHAVLPIGGMAEAQRWYYAAAMLAVAAPYLAVATWRATASLGHEEAQPTAGTAFLWGHLCIAASAAFALLPMASGRATPLGGVTVVALAGGVYVICARLIRDASLAYTGGGALALAGLLALDSSHLASTWSAWAVMLTVLGLVAAALMLGESRARRLGGARRDRLGGCGCLRTHVAGSLRVRGRMLGVSRSSGRVRWALYRRPGMARDRRSGGDLRSRVYRGSDPSAHAGDSACRRSDGGTGRWPVRSPSARPVARAACLSLLP
jgi:hypothetical protein